MQWVRMGHAKVSEDVMNAVGTNGSRLGYRGCFQEFYKSVSQFANLISSRQKSPLVWKGLKIQLD